MEIFEEMCRMYLNGSDEVKETILSFLNEEDKETFLKGVSFYKLFTQPDFYKAVCNTVAGMIYEQSESKALTDIDDYVADVCGGWL